jgi:ribonuclease Z
LPSLPVQVSDDPPNDGYALIPFELTLEDYWAGKNIAYDNKSTGVKITYFPVIHARKGSLGYKLEWTPPGIPGAKTLSMIYTSDTRPEELSIEQAINEGRGVDVFIHEMSPAAQIWAMKGANLPVPPDPDSPVVQNTAMVQNSSHTPQGAFGYMLSQIEPRPRLTVATHFPVADDTVECAMKSVLDHCPDAYQGNAPKAGTRITWPLDLMVISVSEGQILEQKGMVSNYNNSAINQPIPSGTKNPPKYRKEDGTGDPYAQIDRATEIDPCDCETGECHYRVDGY